ncbi:MAG: hypothetical protein AB7I13_12090 [Vicinamibacterales bacterium]
MIKASRRDMFRGVFGRVGFELPIEVAHEVLMRLNGLMDPIPVSVPMWDSYLAARRPLRYADFSRARSDDEAGIARELGQASAHADFGRFPDYIAQDLQLLLRVEILLRMWAAAAAAEGDSSSGPAERRSLQVRRRAIADVLHDELAAYLQRQAVDEAVAKPRVADVASYLLTEVQRRMAPSAGA